MSNEHNYKLQKESFNHNLTIVPTGSSSGERPLNRDLTPESKSTNTPSRSQNILYLNDDTASSSASSSALALADLKKPVSDDCCCLVFFLDDDFLSEEPLLRFNDILLSGSVLINGEVTKQQLLA